MRERSVARAIAIALVGLQLVSMRSWAADEKPAPAQLDLLIVDPDGKPVTNATVDVNVDGKTDKVAARGDGHAILNLPTNPAAYFGPRVRAAGFVDVIVEWRNRRTDPVPATYTLKMTRGTKIGGKVVDDKGQAVGGAHVEIWSGGQTATNQHERFFGNKSLTTNPDGTWSFEGAGTGGNVNVGVWDYRYANGDFYDMHQMSAEEIKSGNFTVTLKTGVPIEGVILKPDGSPLSGAKVGWGGEMASNRIPPLKTDKEGKFNFAAIAGTEVVLTITSKGYATELTHFTMPEEKKSISVQMTKGKPMIGRVVDADGKPVPNAWIYPDTWRGYRSLEARVKADKNGKFTWADAPVDEVLCDVDATQSGFLRSSRVPMTASDDEIVVTVQKSMRIRGTVVDAATSQPVANFRIVRGQSSSVDSPPSWNRYENVDGKDGKFDLDQTWEQPAYAIRIEADGYAPANSRNFTKEEKNVQLDFKLTKAEATQLSILDADDKPVADAQVMVLEKGTNTQLQHGQNMFGRDIPSLKSDQQGQVKLSSPSADAKAVVTSEKGYAEVLMSAATSAGKIKLQPWGKIEGVAMIGSKPAANQQIYGSHVQEWNSNNERESRVFHNLSGTTDAQGHFAIDHVPAGKTHVGLMHTENMGRYSTNEISQMQTIDMKPGETVTVTIGGKGRPIEGKVVLPAEFNGKKPDNATWRAELQTSIEGIELPIPDNVKKMPAKQRQEWLINWSKSDEGKAFQQKQQKAYENMKRYAMRVSPDGSFHVDDVLAGKYSLSVSLYDSSNQNQQRFGMYSEGNLLASAQTVFTIDPMPGDRSDEVQKIPDLAAKAIKQFNKGDDAPELTLKNLEGTDFSLSSLKGKFVLLTFIPPEMHPIKTDDYKLLHSLIETYSGDDRFVSLTVCPSDSATDVQEVAPKIQIGNKVVQMLHTEQMYQLMHVQQYPTSWLIDGNGKMVAKELRGAAIQSAVNSALGPPAGL